MMGGSQIVGKDSPQTLPLLSDEDRQRLIIEAIKMKRASHLADRQKAQSMRSLPDVLESLSREGELTEDENR
jgi:hypothetical protein